MLDAVRWSLLDLLLLHLPRYSNGYTTLLLLLFHFSFRSSSIAKMCIIYHVTWLHPNGALQPQQYPALCEKSINGQFCSPPAWIDRGQLPAPPQFATPPNSSSEEPQGASASTDTQDTEDSRRRKVVGWVRPARKKRNSDDSVQKVLIRGASFAFGGSRLGNQVYKEVSSRRRNGVWTSSIALEEVPVPPRAPTPPAAANGFVGYGTYNVSGLLR